MDEPTEKFRPGCKALAYHGPLVYEAKVLKVHVEGKTFVDLGEGRTEPLLANKIPNFLREKDAYFLHYKGWSSKWDEWVSSERIMEFNDDNLGLSRELRNARKKTIERLDSGRGKDDEEENLRKRKRAAKNQTPQPGGKANGSAKRKRPEPKSMYEILLPLRPRLKCVLVDDWEIITRDRKLVDLESTTPVSVILQTYLKQKLETVLEEEYDTIKEVAFGLRTYFDEAFGLRLLYRFERLQYVEEMNRIGHFNPSDIYGVEHLLRLLVSIPGLAGQTSMNLISMNILMKYIEDFLDFIDDNMETFGSVYCNTSPQYDRLSRTQ